VSKTRLARPDLIGVCLENLRPNFWTVAVCIAAAEGGIETMRSDAQSQAEAVPVGGEVDLNLLMLFVQIVEAGSISQAAARLQSPKATLSRKLRQLEEQIGAVLLKRGPHSRELTDVGRALLTHCERIAAEASIASRIAAEMQSHLSGIMHISIPIGLGGTWISRTLAQFAIQHPDLKLTIDVTNRWIDVSEEPYDVAIYIGRVRNEHIPVRLLAKLPRAVYASPSYLERAGTPLLTADLLSHQCIVLDNQLTDGLWTFADPEDGTQVKVSPRMTVTDVVVAREMAVAGLGLAILTHALCEVEVKSGKLVQVLHDHSIPPVPICATFLERRHMPLRTRAFIDLLAETIQAELRLPV
jgi:DNA-binding transcriptional LysR family regulator